MRGGKTQVLFPPAVLDMHCAFWVGNQHKIKEKLYSMNKVLEKKRFGRCCAFYIASPLPKTP